MPGKSLRRFRGEWALCVYTVLNCDTSTQPPAGSTLEVVGYCANNWWLPLQAAVVGCFPLWSYDFKSRFHSHDRKWCHVGDRNHVRKSRYSHNIPTKTFLYYLYHNGALILSNRPVWDIWQWNAEWFGPESQLCPVATADQRRWRDTARHTSTNQPPVGYVLFSESGYLSVIGIS